MSTPGRFLLLAMLAGGCGHGRPVASGRDADENLDLWPWVAALREAWGSDPVRATSMLRRIDAIWDGSDAIFAAADESCDQHGREHEHEVDHLDAPLDDDDEPEVIVRVSSRSAKRSPLEQCEHVWLGVFDAVGPRHRFLGALHATGLRCLDDLEGRRSMFTVRAERTGLSVEIQRVASCGTLVDYDYVRYRLELRDGELQVTAAGAIEGVHQDRLADLAFELPVRGR